jgi:putative RNA 2'-phosphotransferase
MMSDDVRLSKRLSLWLRHQPGEAGLTLDAKGWTEVDAVLSALARAGLSFDWSTLLRLVEESDKQRFELSPDASRIRARQGHSVAVALSSQRGRRGRGLVPMPGCPADHERSRPVRFAGSTRRPR